MAVFADSFSFGSLALRALLDRAFFGLLGGKVDVSAVDVEGEDVSQLREARRRALVHTTPTLTLSVASWRCLLHVPLTCWQVEAVWHRCSRKAGLPASSLPFRR